MNYIIRHINWDNLDCVGVTILAAVATLWSTLLLAIVILVDLTIRLPLAAVMLIPIGLLTIGFAGLTYSLVQLALLVFSK